MQKLSSPRMSLLGNGVVLALDVDELVVKQMLMRSACGRSPAIGRERLGFFHRRNLRPGLLLRLLAAVSCWAGAPHLGLLTARARAHRLRRQSTEPWLKELEERCHFLNGHASYHMYLRHPCQGLLACVHVVMIMSMPRDADGGCSRAAWRIYLSGISMKKNL